MKNKNIATLGILGLLLFSTVACSKEKSSNYTIAGIIYQNESFARTVQIGMEAAGKEMGATILLGNADNKVDKEASLIDTYIARGVDAIAITPIGFGGGSDVALQRAADAGIKLVYFNTKANVPAVSYIGTSNTSLGKAAGETARAYIESNFSGESIDIATVSFRSQLPAIAEERTGTFLKELNGLSINIVSDQDAWLPEMGIRVVGDMLTANPTIKLIHAANNGGTEGAVQAIRNAGKTGEIVVFGTDGGEPITKMLLADDNVLQTSIAQEPFKIGYTAIEVAIRSLKGEKVESEINVPPRILRRSEPEELKKYLEEIKSYQ